MCCWWWRAVWWPAADTAPGRLGRCAQKPGRRPTAGVLPGPVAVDFGSEAMRHRRRSGHNELLGRAVGVKGRRQPGYWMPRRAWVATALCWRIWAARLPCERNPVIAAMLARACRRRSAVVTTGRARWFAG